MENRHIKHRRELYWLFVIPFVAVLVPNFFNFSEPTLGGMPFFYWYQLLWVPITVLLTWYVAREA